MPRETLDREIHHLQNEVLVLGSMVEHALFNAVDTLRTRDLSASRRITNDDRLINEKRFAVENAILITIATQQPMAHDLRSLTAILEVITELERMGDYAKGIAKVSMLLGEEKEIIPFSDITRMLEIGLDMLHRALDAFIAEDPDLARAIVADDDLVDDLYNKINRNLVSAMINNPAIIDHANYLLWVAHNLERMADRVTNICERTVFIATGELLELSSSDDEMGEND